MSEIKYIHKEAFCLMRYKCTECGHEEIIWNSRDGVTPFGTACPDCSASMLHVDWGYDTCEPEYSLNRFQKFWRNGTQAEARISLQNRFTSMKGTKYERTNKEVKVIIEEILAEGSEFPEGWPILDIKRSR